MPCASPCCLHCQASLTYPHVPVRVRMDQVSSPCERCFSIVTASLGGTLAVASVRERACACVRQTVADRDSRAAPGDRDLAHRSRRARASSPPSRWRVGHGCAGADRHPWALAPAPGVVALHATHVPAAPSCCSVSRGPHLESRERLVRGATGMTGRGQVAVPIAASSPYRRVRRRPIDPSPSALSRWYTLTPNWRPRQSQARTGR